MLARLLTPVLAVTIATAIACDATAVQASDYRDLVVQASGRAVRIRVAMTVDGQSVAERRQALLDSVVAAADQDRNGTIDAAEWRSALETLGQSAEPPGESEQNTIEGLSKHLEAQAGSLVEIVVQPQPLVDRLELLTALDSDADLYVTATELENAVKLLETYDADGDGLLSQPELAPTEPLQPTPLRSGDNFPTGRFPFRWEEATGEPDFTVEIKLIGRAFGRPKVAVSGTPASQTAAKTDTDFPSINSEPRKASIDFAGIGLDLEATPARITSEDVKRFYLLQLRQRDADKNGYLDEAEFLGLGLPGLDFQTADANGDGMLFPEELRERLDALIVRETSRVRIDASYERQPLFSKLDRDGDERLSQRELIEASRSLRSVDTDNDGRIGLGEFGGRYRLAFKVPNLLEGATPRMLADFQAMPRGPSPRALEGPAWFAAMDRNADGDVSQREFLSTAAHFSELDQDRDGLISPEEATSAENVAPQNQ